MAKFIKVLVLFFCFNLLLIVCSVACYFFYYDFSLNDIPAPGITSNYSFNEKMEFLRKSKRPANVIAIGSSMSLNNLHSKTIMERLHTDSFLNTASWGVSMKNNFYVLKILAGIYKPHTIIMAGSIKDFSLPEQKEDYSALNDYLNSEGIGYLYYQVKNFKPVYYFNNLKYAKKVRTISNDYEYLGFDNYGTVNYDSAGFKINNIRWNTDYLSDEIESCQYDYFDSIALFCKSNHLKMFFFECPYRQGLYSALNQQKLDRLNRHLSMIEGILKKNDQVFVNPDNVLWDDRLFIDGMHFNKYGAKLFTEYCFEKAEKIN